MEIIGRGSINMNREFYSHDWRQPYFEDDIFPHYKLPIPTESALTIGVIFNIYPEARDTFKLQSYELMTNFATSNFSGKLQMGFTYSHVDDDTINFTFRVPIFPTHFEPVVVVKLHYMDTKAGLKFTSYFKCNMAKLERDKYSTEHKYCEFQIINPHSFTYHSSEQAALPAEGQLGAVPSSQRMDASTSKPGAAKPASASATKVCPNCGQVNQADFRFCTKCRYTFPVTPPSQPQASSKLQATAASTSPKTPPAKMSVHYLNRGTRYHVGDNAFSNSTDKEFVGAYPVVGQAWAQPFALSHDDEVVIVIEHLWGVDYYHNNVVYIGDTEVGRIDGEHNHKQWTSPSAVALKGGKTYLVKVTSQGPGDADDFVFEGVIVQTKGDTKMQVMGKPKILQNPEDDYWSSTYDQGASAAKARQCPDCGYANQAGSNFCMRCGYNFLTSASRQTIVPPSKPVPQPTQPPVYTPPASVQQPVYTSSQPAYQQPMQFVTMPEKEKTTGCWGVGLGIATIIGGIVLIFAGLALFDNAAGLLYLADALFGIIAGIISIAKRNTAGVVMCIVAWVLVVFITLLVVAVG